MCDKLVFDLSQEVEGSPAVFVRKDWINILDNQNQNYSNNQSIIDTSQLSNSNKYMSYREAYLSIPLLLTLSTPKSASASAVNIFDYGLGLKNWFGTIIHSFTLDYNGTTIIQQTPFINMWNIFKLLTSLSYQDVLTMGQTIGFYPDTSGAWAFQRYVAGTASPFVADLGSPMGINVCNNEDGIYFTTSPNLKDNRYDQFLSNTTINTGQPYNNLGGNIGLTYRTKWICFNPKTGTITSDPVGANYEIVGVSGQTATQIWKSNLSTNQNFNSSFSGCTQISVMATVYLRHLCSFFNMCPLLKGVFMKMTMNLNNASSTVTVGSPTVASGSRVAQTQIYKAYTSNVPVGGCQPIMIPSINTGSNWMRDANSDTTDTIYSYNISVGAVCTDSTVSQTLLSSYVGNVSKSIYLYVPAYTFNPVFEKAYLSNPVKQIKYTDVYQYQVLNIASGQPFNNLITNGIANIKSVLIIPFYATSYSGASYLEYQSPFDSAGCGTTAPMVTLGNFNVQISGQNAIYNTQRYTFEEFNNQLYGQNSVNGGLTDGLSSGLIGFNDFQNSYCYHYVNVERMLPVEQSVPKSVQIVGTNYSTNTLNLWVFVEYGAEIAIDLLTGARV